MWVTVEDMKRHINVDFGDDDALIGSYIQAAEQAVANAINVPLAKYELNGKLPAPLIHSIRLIAAKLYEFREGTSHGKPVEVPFTLGFLLSPYVVLS